MTDTLEYSDVAIPRERFTDALLAELEATIASRLERDGDYVVIRHVYIERRLIPLNLFLPAADDAATIRAMRDYGNALRELAAVNIFPGDLLFKNFGVTRYGRVVFYDYDEIEYLTDCRFRAIPARPPDVDELTDEVWHPVGANAFFPEESAGFLLPNPSIRPRSSPSTRICSIPHGGRRCRKPTAPARRSKCCRIRTACASRALRR